MLIKTFGSAVFGVNAATITIEVNVDRGAQIAIVGLPDSAIKEAQQRIRAALANSGYEFPVRNITINMAPADLRKEGTAYDLPLAVGLLAATEAFSSDELAHYIMMGELSLDGSLRPIRGSLPIAIQAQKEGFKGIILPAVNAEEAAIVEGFEVYGVQHMGEVIEFFTKENALQRVVVDAREEFSGVNTTTEFLTKYIFDVLAKAARSGDLGRDGSQLHAIRVTLSESHVARAWYEAEIH